MPESSLDGPGVARLVGLLRTGSDLPRWTGTTLPDGTSIGHPMGVGGMCVVFAGETADGRPCAVKALLPDTAGQPDLRRRFAGEARLLLSRAIAGLPRGLAASEYEGIPYVVMERIDGPTLADVLRTEGRLESARAVRIARQVLEILERIHRRGIVHRDIKPENVVLRDGRTPCLLDFGIAKLERRPEAGPTRQGEFLGTLPYAAPEHLDDARRAEARSDLFSVGVLLLEMLTGSTLAEKPRATRASQARALLILEGLPESLGRAIERALAEDARRRFPGARAMARALAGAPLTSFLGWILDRPAVVVGVELSCVAVVLGTVLLGAWRRADELGGENARLRADALVLAKVAAELRAENAGLRDQRDSPIRTLLLEDLREKYRTLLLLDRVRGPRELPRFLAACEGLRAQASDPALRAEVDALRTAVAWRATERTAVLRVTRGRFAAAWGDTPDTRVRVSRNGAEVACSRTIEDRCEPEYEMELRLALRPFDELSLVVEECDLDWEPLFRLDSAAAEQHLDPVLALDRLGRGAPLDFTVEWTEPAPPLPELE